MRTVHRLTQSITGAGRKHERFHHLSPRIPNYNLEPCYKSDPLFQTVKPITLRSSLKCLKLRLWDEQHHRLVGFGGIKQLREGETTHD